MKDAIKNPITEQFAQDLAAAINVENGDRYKAVMALNKNILDGMVRWELLAFRERVHYLVELNGGPIK